MHVTLCVYGPGRVGAVESARTAARSSGKPGMGLLPLLGRHPFERRPFSICVIAEQGRSFLSARANVLLIYANRSSLRTATARTTATGSTNMAYMLLSFDRGHILTAGFQATIRLPKPPPVTAPHAVACPRGAFSYRRLLKPNPNPSGSKRAAMRLHAPKVTPPREAEMVVSPCS